ncbi:hypothetical protein BGX27_003356 [Mortierella sp. AM989]|nr:hypothetical protein BGX27_003356 [Mortierella sp. AM989]
MARFITKRSRPNISDVPAQPIPMQAQGPFSRNSSSISREIITPTAQALLYARTMLDLPGQTLSPMLGQGEGSSVSSASFGSYGASKTKETAGKRRLPSNDDDDVSDNMAGYGSQTGEYGDESSSDDEWDSDGGYNDDESDYENENEDDNEVVEEEDEDKSIGGSRLTFQSHGIGLGPSYGDFSESLGSDNNYDYVHADITDPDWEDSGDLQVEYPDVVLDGQYHPDHPYVRSRIDGLYFELSNSREVYLPLSSSPSTAPRITNIQQLIDQLIQSSLPQFWRHREQDQVLNRYSGMIAQNSRPHQHAMLVTCVDCGFKFHKQPLYDCPATERHDQRKARQLAIQGEGSGAKRRSPWKERKVIKAVELFYRLQGRAIRRDSFSPTEIDDILNNNRRSNNYDGNLDYIGLKEEGHPIDCPRNHSSKSHGTKLHLGWEIVLGHNHSAIPVFPIRNTDSSSTARGPYYPARSIMASFAHLLPRGQTLPQNQIRKLFAYFIWHRWFDCDLQAITIRRAYSELWPVYMLRDEEPELTSEEITMFRREHSSRGQIKKRKAGKQVYADHYGVEHHSKKQKLSLGSSMSTAAGKQTRVGDEQSRSTKRKATPEVRAAKERARLLSIEQRYTTLMNIGLMNHGVDNESRHLSVQEQVRRAKENSRGWILGHSEYLGNNGENSGDLGYDDGEVPKVKVIHKIFEYTVRSRNTPTTGYRPLIQNLTNPAFTRPHEPDALSALSRRLNHLARRAVARREQLGFVLPEYMTPHKTKGQRAAEVKARSNAKAARKRNRTDSFIYGTENSRGIEARSTDGMEFMGEPATPAVDQSALFLVPRAQPSGSGHIAAPLTSTLEQFPFLNVPSQARRNDELYMENLNAASYSLPGNKVVPSTSLNNVYSRSGTSLQPVYSPSQSGFFYSSPSTNALQEVNFNTFLNFSSTSPSGFAAAPSVINRDTASTISPFTHTATAEANFMANVSGASTSNVASTAGNRKVIDGRHINTETNADADNNYQLP